MGNLHAYDRPADVLLRALLAAWLLVLGACASLPQQIERSPSQALADPLRTALGRAVTAAQPRPGQSAFRLVAEGSDALDARQLLAERAQRTLDLQYYIVRNDAPTRSLMAAVRAAADRGVRVRMLIDDMQTEGLDAALDAFSQHRNIELRLFNPFPGQRANLLTRLLSAPGELGRLNRRMHNKAFIADNAVAIAGGRNLGAEYFLQDERMNFADLDIVAAGPVVRDMSRSFDRFWNSDLAYPIQAFAQDAREAPPAPALAEDAPAEAPQASAAPAAAAAAPSAQARASAAAESLAAAAPPEPMAPARGATLAALLGRFGELTWASSFLLADAPAKIEFGSDSGDELIIADNLEALLRRARRDVTIVSPYFVPGTWGMELIGELRARGVRVRVLTNSLAATDVPRVHAGYTRYRRQLLEMGVELHELQPLPGRPRGWLGSVGSSQASLHAKAAVVDGRVAFVGSLNLDPRSMRSNTEMGVVIDSLTLSRQLLDLYEQSVSPENSFRPRLAADGRSLEWLSKSDGGAEQRFTHEPEADLMRRLIHRVLGPLAPDALL